MVQYMKNNSFTDVNGGTRNVDNQNLYPIKVEMLFSSNTNIALEAAVNRVHHPPEGSAQRTEVKSGRTFHWFSPFGRSGDNSSHLIK